MRECCKICTYQKLSQDGYHGCFRFPPVPVGFIQKGDGVGAFFGVPPAADTGWCGEFRMNPALFSQGDGD